MNERVTVLGHHRVSYRWIEMIEEKARLTNFRAKPAYDPWVRTRLGSAPWQSKAQCEAAAEGLNSYLAPIPDLRAAIERHRHAFDLLDVDARGRALYAQAVMALAMWTPQQRQQHTPPPHEAQVLADYLEDRGVPIPLDELVRTLDRRRPR